MDWAYELAMRFAVGRPVWLGRHGRRPAERSEVCVRGDW